MQSSDKQFINANNKLTAAATHLVSDLVLFSIVQMQLSSQCKENINENVDEKQFKLSKQN